MEDAVSAWLESFDAASRRDFRRSLERWYLRTGRSLPWRETADPYRVWVSEIMLQQTTVKAVVPYYERFLERFPTVQSLASASEQDVLKHWEGLGYYSRGRHLRLAAQKICEVHAGQFPDDLDSLQALPGVGRYTAGAIRSFGFNLPAPIVEANTLRLYCRLLGYRGDPRSREGQALLWRFAEHLQPRALSQVPDAATQAEPVVRGVLNQALMELGATVCTPASPRCPECPVSRYCSAFVRGEQGEIPVPKSRPVVTQLVEGAVAIQQGSRWLVRQRGPEERWAGMWDFPRFPLENIPSSGPLSPVQSTGVLQQAEQFVRDQLKLEVTGLTELMQIRHSVTRYRIRLLCVHGLAVSGAVGQSGVSAFRWADLADLESIPMPVTGRRFASRLQQWGEGDPRGTESGPIKKNRRRR